ncbi:hypothetical protein B0H67DRAFT_644774 [Lasiosphaeris hirsuta]|uniref:Uncharacterized protein n=1 Tax=Lasiosphaeris hirsuta TaxID=260670 RepID=A0AA40AFP2_9PEZI|nr:hypothetical protein B0H67DRAFT_644774 [Lasiosphaeris hirsuta]
MTIQLPGDALAVVDCILVYSIICLGTSLFLFWLVWAHNERTSYVTMMGFFMSLSVLASIMQQIHTIAEWRGIKTAQYQNVVANRGCRTGTLYLSGAKFEEMIVLRQKSLQHSISGYMVLADFVMILSFGVGCILLLAILGKYIYARIALVTWNVRHGQSGGDTETSASRSKSGPARPKLPQQPRKNIYDRWLVLRFTIAFIALGLFEVVVVTFQLHSSYTNNTANIPLRADLSRTRAISDFALFVPGVTAAPLTFVVFGTMRTIRDYMAALSLPKLLQKLEKRMRRKKPSVVIPSRDMPGYPRRRLDEENSPGSVRMHDFAKEEAGGRIGRWQDDDEWPMLKPLLLAPLRPYPT